jgi:hypothetical protein
VTGKTEGAPLPDGLRQRRAGMRADGRRAGVEAAPGRHGEGRACGVEAARERGGRAFGLGWGRRRGSSDGGEATVVPLLWIGSRGWGKTHDGGRFTG